MHEKVTQEFYCNGCDGYFRVRLNIALDRNVVVVCPNCGHRHARGIKKGVIIEAYGKGDNDEEIWPPRSAYSKESLALKMKKMPATAWSSKQLKTCARTMKSRTRSGAPCSRNCG